MCGEHLNAVAGGNADTGSSPRVRGTHELPVVLPEALGIIPACAGNTLYNAGASIISGDHPRVCGEHGVLIQRLIGLYGIIPACAGNTLWCGLGSAIGRDHPRVCGEHPQIP